jgi:hypothetical protein
MRRWEDNVKVNLKEIGYKVVDWSHVAQESTDGLLRIQ